MQEHIYKVVELVGSSETSIEDAINVAISRANETIRQLRWFEVLQTAVTSRMARSGIIRWRSRSALPWKPRAEGFAAPRGDCGGARLAPAVPAP